MMNPTIRKVALISLCVLASLLSWISNSSVGHFLIAGGSDVLVLVGRPSFLAMAASVAFVIASAIAIARWPRSKLALGSVVAATLIWLAMGRGVSISLTSGDIHGHWFLLRTDSVSLRPVLVEPEVFMRDVEISVSGWQAKIQYKETSETIWLGPFLVGPARSLFKKTHTMSSGMSK